MPMILAVVLAVLWSGSLVAAEPSFRREVAPVLVRRCLGCHSAEKAKGEYHLHSFAAMLQSGETGEKPIVGGAPEKSHLLKLLITTDAAERMPKDADPLKPAEIEVLKNWINAGAKYDGDDPQEPLVAVSLWTHPAAPEAYPRAFPITALAFHPAGDLLAVGGMHEVTFWNPADGKLEKRIGGLAERIYSLAWHSDGKQLAVAAGTPGQMGEVKLIDFTSGSVRHLTTLADAALSVAFSPAGDRLAIGAADRMVRVFELASGKEMVRSAEHSDWVSSVAFSPDAARLVTASRDRTCKVLDAKTGALVTTYAEHNAPVFAIAVPSEGKQALSVGGDGRLHVWLPEDPGYEDKEMKKAKKHQIAAIQAAPSDALAVVLGEKRAYLAATDKAIRELDPAAKSQVRTLAGHSDWVAALSFHGGKKLLASGSLDGEVRIWNVTEKDPAKALQRAFSASPGFQATRDGGPLK